jgi:hypothetical protein
MYDAIQQGIANYDREMNPGQQRTVPADQQRTVLAASTLLDRNIKTLGIGTSSSPATRWPVATRALIEVMGYGDDDAVWRLADESLRNAPDATDEEIAHFIREEAPRVMRNRKLDNPMGMLIRQVPRRFVGEALQIYRDAQRRAEAAQIARNLGFAREILEDPNAVDEDRSWAESIIKEHQEG